jgi:ferritin-like protein
MDKLKQLIDRSVSRRKFVVGAGAVAGATAALTITGCGGGSSSNPTPTPTPTPAPTPTDNDVLNYALNLEYLEAQFYLFAATGAGLAATDITAGASSSFTGQGTVTKGNAAQVAGLTPAQQQILNEIAFEERAHVRFLRTALGAAAVPMPDIDLSFFGPLAVAAGITTATAPAFNPFASFDDFLVGAFIFEDLGVTAYAGAAGLISSAGVQAGLLDAAAGILAVEAYHAGYIRTALTGRAITAGSAAAYPYLGIANKVEDLRAMLTVGASAAPSTSGSVETLLVLPTNTTTPSSIVAADPDNAVGFARTPNQVHHVAYGNATVGASKGGFFPSGTNSVFAVTTA